MRTQKAEQRELKRNIKENQRQLDLDQCLQRAAKDYSTNWDRHCETRGLKDDCALPLILVESVNKFYRDAKEDCFKQYPKTE
jgi:hypothetical protein